MPVASIQCFRGINVAGEHSDIFNLIMLCVCVLKRTGSIYKKGGHQDRRQFWISFLHLNLWRNIAEILLLSIHPNFLSWPVKHAQEVVVAQQRRQKTLKMHLYLFVTFAVLGVNEASLHSLVLSQTFSSEMGTILLSIGLFHTEEIVKTSKCLNSLVSDVSVIFAVGLLSKQQKQHATILQVSFLGTSCPML